MDWACAAVGQIVKSLAEVIGRTENGEVLDGDNCTGCWVRRKVREAGCPFCVAEQPKVSAYLRNCPVDASDDGPSVAECHFRRLVNDVVTWLDFRSPSADFETVLVCGHMFRALNAISVSGVVAVFRECSHGRRLRDRC